MASSTPTLHLFEPCSSLELSIESAGCEPGWFLPEDEDAPGYEEEENMCTPKDHSGMELAPPVARTIANAINEALSAAMLPASESDTTGLVIVISCGQEMSPLNACFDALSIRERGRQYATCVPLDLDARRESGFCYRPDDLPDEDEENEDDEESDRAKILRATAIMGDRLKDTFEFNFNDSVVAAPVIYGGLTEDGDIVGVIGMRVWT